MLPLSTWILVQLQRNRSVSETGAPGGRGGGRRERERGEGGREERARERESDVTWMLNQGITSTVTILS